MIAPPATDDCTTAPLCGDAVLLTLHPTETVSPDVAAAPAAVAPPKQSLKRKLSPERATETRATAQATGDLPPAPTPRQRQLLQAVQEFDVPARETDWWRVSKELATFDMGPIMTFLESEILAGKGIAPRPQQFLRALLVTPLASVKVVLLSQDPYPTPGDACGLCFSHDGRNVPRSLQNIFAEIESEFPSKRGKRDTRNPNLTRWANQGVLLLNTVLSVRTHEPNSHTKAGWNALTDLIIQVVDGYATHPVVFLLWGQQAQAKGTLVNPRLTRLTDSNVKHHILTAAHPSPRSFDKGFKGCGHFRQTNKILLANNLQPIDW